MSNRKKGIDRFAPVSRAANTAYARITQTQRVSTVIKCISSCRGYQLYTRDTEKKN